MLYPKKYKEKSGGGADVDQDGDQHDTVGGSCTQVRVFMIFSAIMFIFFLVFLLLFVLRVGDELECLSDDQCLYGTCNVAKNLCDCTQNVGYFRCSPQSIYHWSSNWFGLAVVIVLLIWLVGFITFCHSYLETSQLQRDVERLWDRVEELEKKKVN